MVMQFHILRHMHCIMRRLNYRLVNLILNCRYVKTCCVVGSANITQRDITDKMVVHTLKRMMWRKTMYIYMMCTHLSILSLPLRSHLFHARSFRFQSLSSNVFYAQFCIFFLYFSNECRLPMINFYWIKILLFVFLSTAHQNALCPNDTWIYDMPRAHTTTSKTKKIERVPFVYASERE